MRLILAVVALTFAAPAFAHGGGLNKCGCHFNRSTGECHCHQPNGDCSCACSCQVKQGPDLVEPTTWSPDQGVPVVLCKDTTVPGYVKKSGTYVAPHQRTAPNKSKSDNWSSKGNQNPYTGEKGSRDPYAPKKVKGALDL
jgi:hypothetical protein